MTTKDIIDLLGGPKLITAIESNRDIIDALRRGFPAAVANAVLETTKLNADIFWEAFGMQPEDLLAATVLSKDRSEFLLNVARAFAAAMEVFEDSAVAAKWLVTISKALDDVPLYLLDTTVGFESVVDELARINYGVVS